METTSGREWGERVKWALPFLLLLSGCSLNRFVPPPYAAVVVHHSRFFGLSASYEGYGVKLGWGSDVFAVIPVHTNKIYASPILDTFDLGQTVSPFSTRIVEDLSAGCEGQPPAPRFQKLFEPKPKP